MTEPTIHTMTLTRKPARLGHEIDHLTDEEVVMFTFRDVVAWLRDNVVSVESVDVHVEVVVSQDVAVVGRPASSEVVRSMSLILSFADESEAILFKLRWM